MAHWSLEG